ncbi:sunset domain-containing protein [Actinophytocola xanthii]|uniref:Uncharacterized protein n=1 Tax=Actinophytocola xanthii TaxID=1912961 RepID=A0A1Q8CLT3_9PSEU|nr:hypothetical protein [Actinophytocola xanthii]OLF15313.1 hypothetical protein BU204_22925 [Actinophytocola xanthii]
MSIFGQVWLWSSLAFLLGALLCWGLVALPARRRVAELESELAARSRRQAPQPPELPRRPQEEREEFDPRRLVTGGGREPEERPERHEVQNEPLTRAYAMPGVAGAGALGETETELSVGPGAAATQYLNTAGSSSLQAPPADDEENRGWFDDDERAEDQPGATTVFPRVPAEDPAPVEAPEGAHTLREVPSVPDDGGTVFTQRTHPIPGELIRQLDESSSSEPSAEDRPPSSPSTPSSSDLSDSPAAPEESPEPAPAPAHALVEEETPATGESKHRLREDSPVTSTVTPPAEPAEAAEGAHDRSEAVPAHTAGEQSTAVSASRRRGIAGDDDQSSTGAEEPKHMSGVNVQAEPARNKLPKRVPSKPPSRTPFGVQTTSPATQPPSTTSAAERPEDAPRSLFEPIIPAGDAPSTPPPPNRKRSEGERSGSERSGSERSSNGSLRGPFGPGSAMPLPGGGAPSPEFTVKASASAMRYCTPESDGFERTVAEVWFRSAADAERVGFRPLG